MSQNNPQGGALMRFETATEEALASPEFDVFKLGEVLAKSGYFVDAKDAAQCIVKVLAGRELGFGPIASMTGVYIIQGKPSLAANLMAAAIKRSGKYNYRVRQMDNDGCKIEFFENGESIGISEFTTEDAKVAGALDGKNKHTWAAFKRNMLFARALSNGARWYTPDIFGGPVYTPEEMNAPVNNEGEFINATAAPVRQLQAAPTVEATAESPEEQRAALVKDILTIGNQLNDAGDTVEDSEGQKGLWTGRSLKDFINREFQVDDGLRSLSFDSLKQLQGILNLRLEKAQREKK